MENPRSETRAMLVKDLKMQALKLQSELTKMSKAPNADEALHVSLQKTDAHFSVLRDPKGSSDVGLGKYFLSIDITAGKEALYIPISIASGRKSTGFIYQIEGTAGGVSTASVTSKGEGVSTVTSGSLSYSKIPRGMTATFKILAQVTGSLGKTYKIVISRINYKLNPNDLRYKRFLTDISSDTLKFR